MFRTSILPHLLPFPVQKTVDWHHDLWTALVASQLGHIAHVEQPLVQYRRHGQNILGAVEGAATLPLELKVWFQKRCRITGRSYLIHRDLSQAFEQRFRRSLAPNWNNPFDDRVLDFGFNILKLGFRSVIRGYGSEGVTMRLFALKFLFDIKRIKEWVARFFIQTLSGSKHSN